MRYIPRPGIVRTKICGVNVLIPSREASEQCSVIQRLPMLWALTWDGIAAGKPKELILSAHKIFKKQCTDEEIEADVRSFCEDLAEKGFLIRVSDEEDLHHT